MDSRAPLADHLHRWRIAYLCAALSAAVWGLNRWAASANAERDAGFTRVFAYSPRTMQSYDVRATVEDGRLQAFHLERETYTFRGCALPAREERVECRDQAGQPWMIEP